MRSKIKDYIIILIFALIVSVPLMNKNIDIYRDDGIQHIARLMGTYQSIEEKQFIPVIMSNFCNGFGYSWNIFYSPITAYIPLVFKLFTDSFELILKIFIILVSFLSGISMYEFVKRITNNKYTGVLAACIYIFAPYRLTDIYMRVAIAEITSFLFIPIVFNGMYNIFDTEEKSIKRSLLLTLGAVGLILTHIVIAMYTAIICFIYLIINIKKLKNKKVIKMLMINILLILLLSSFYLVPMLEHRNATEYEVFQSGRMERTDELIKNKVDFIDLIYTKQGSFAFEIGLMNILGLAFTILVYKKVNKEYKIFYWFSFITGVICIIFSLRFFPFERMPSILKMIQFTFRLLEFSTFFFTIVVAINYSLIIKNFKMRDALILSIISILLIIPLIKNLDFDKIWSEDKLWPAYRVTENTGRVHAGCATFEYLPSKAFNNLDYIANRDSKLYILDGSANIENEEKNGINMTFDIYNNKANTIIELPYIYYLGYTVTLQENDTISKIETFESDNGFVAIDLSNLNEEKGTVTVKYSGTTLMKISYLLSFITFIILIIFLILLKIEQKKYSFLLKNNNKHIIL